MPEGKKRYFQPGLATPHTAASTKQFLSDEGVTIVPWMPSGGDCSPLDIFVNPELKKRLRGRNLSTQTKIMEFCARAMGEMAADPIFKEPLKKFCKGIKKRAKWVAAHGGRICTTSLVAPWRGGAEDE